MTYPFETGADLRAMEKLARLAGRGAGRGRRGTDREAEAGRGPHNAMTSASQPIQAGRGDAQPISGWDLAGASSFASTPGASPRGRGREPG